MCIFRINIYEAVNEWQIINIFSLWMEVFFSININIYTSAEINRWLVEMSQHLVVGLVAPCRIHYYYKSCILYYQYVEPNVIVNCLWFNMLKFRNFWGNNFQTILLKISIIQRCTYVWMSLNIMSNVHLKFVEISRIMCIYILIFFMGFFDNIHKMNCIVIFNICFFASVVYWHLAMTLMMCLD